MASIRPRGKSWTAEAWKDGKRRTKTFPTKSRAKAWAAEIESGFDEFVPENITLLSLVDKYKKEVVEHHKGKKQEKLRLTRIVKDLPDIPIAQYKKDQFSKWKNDLLKKVKPATVRRYMTLLQAVFSHAIDEWGYLQTNPLKGVKKPSDAPHRERYPTAKEVLKIIKQLGYNRKKPVVKTKQQQIAVSFLIALESAMRAGEILSINPKNTDLKKRVVDLVDTKNGDRRQVPLSKEAVRLIKQLPKKSFTVSSAVHSQLFRRAVKECEIEDLRFHDSRAAGLMRLSKKVDVLTLARIVGHRSPASLMIYYREKAEDIAKLLD